jgi:4-diphosphocytidyl-2-C-methyl-D-erythritol kinase
MKSTYTLPNAKINIGLNIVGKRPDGYHNLQTVFYPIPITDAIEIKKLENPTSLYEFESSGISIPGDAKENLVVQVFLSLQKEFDLPPVRINLSKHIPVGAGLGGGSSDCAFMMKMLNEYFSLELSDKEMEDRLSSFGADCAFFVRNKPVFAEGVGNVFSPIDLSLKDYFLVLVKPDVHISTKQAYSVVVPAEPTENLKTILTTEPICQWKNNVKNAFEESVFPLYPNLEIIKETLYDMGAVYAAMSGSGSAIYGIFDRPITNAATIFPEDFTYSHQLS